MRKELKLVRLEHGVDGNILVRFANKYGEVDTHVSSIEDLIFEIKNSIRMWWKSRMIFTIVSAGLILLTC